LCSPVFFSSRRRHTISKRDWSSDVCSSDLEEEMYEVLAQGISDAIKIKEVPPSPPILAAHAFMAYLTTGRQLMESRNLPYHSLKELVDQLVTFYWNGLGH